MIAAELGIYPCTVAIAVGDKNKALIVQDKFSKIADIEWVDDN